MRIGRHNLGRTDRCQETFTDWFDSWHLLPAACPRSTLWLQLPLANTQQLAGFRLRTFFRRANDCDEQIAVLVEGDRGRLVEVEQLGRVDLFAGDGQLIERPWVVSIQAKSVAYSLPVAGL